MPEKQVLGMKLGRGNEITRRETNPVSDCDETGLNTRKEELSSTRTGAPTG
jgi:hypothetical protein